MARQYRDAPPHNCSAAACYNSVDAAHVGNFLGSMGEVELGRKDGTKAAAAVQLHIAANVGERGGALAGALGGVRDGAAAGADGGAACSAADADAGHGAVLLELEHHCG